MPLEAGTRLGPYEIVSPLGAGGMGEVYRARDTRLGRDVAIKVLPQHLSAQPDVRARFEREARAVSSLNHPNICTLFDVGREGDTDYLVLELVEGETLEQRLARGRVPTAEALKLGAQIADALDRAHRAGVIHRDLKPANVMLTRVGAKLMDFGLARAVTAGGPGSSATMATLTQTPAGLTAEGTLLGTFQYMAPEQLEGREADARSDIWALGCVLYELFTGRRAFEGRSQASLIAAILEREPPPVGEPPSGAPPSASSGRPVPPQGIERLIRNCLAKDPEERIQTAHDVKLQLRGIAENAGMEVSGIVPGSSTLGAAGPTAAALAEARAAGARATRLAWSVCAAVAIVAAGAVAWLWPAAHRPKPPVLRFRVARGEGATDMAWPRVSPDGKALLFILNDSTGTTSAAVRRLDQVDVHVIPGTQGLFRPYWSPDGREVGFVAGGKLQRVALDGGSPVVICDAPSGADLSWGSKGKILVDGSLTDSLVVVSAGGGTPEPATRIDRAHAEVGSAWPSFLPDGEHFLFIGNMATAGGNIRLGKLGSLDSKILGRSDGRAEWAPGGWVLFVQGTNLMAQKLDLGAAKLTGAPILVADQIRTGSSAGHFSTSPNGFFAYAKDEGLARLRILTTSRAGVSGTKILAEGSLWNPVLSPDGTKLLCLQSGANALGLGEIHSIDLDRGTDTRLTFSNNAAFDGVWSPDGRRFAYGTVSPDGTLMVRVGASDGLGAQDSIRIGPGIGYTGITQWSPDGSRIVGFNNKKCWTVPVDGTSRPVSYPVDSTLFSTQGQISPDGRWIAVTSGTTTDYRVYVYGIGETQGRIQLASVKSFRPHWTKGGREIVYEVGSDLWAVDVDTKVGFHAGTPHRLFTLPMAAPNPSLMPWTVDASGETFYVLAPSLAQGSSQIEVVSDFSSLVTRR